MRFQNINIHNLRNHLNTTIEFSDKLNVFFGLNGAGKTTILEALSICSFSKSFLSVQDSHLITNNEEYYFIEGELLNDLNLSYRVKIYYKLNFKKEINSTYGEHLKPQDIIGIIPLVALSPNNKSITTGSPAERRLFIDRIICQSSKKYLKDILNQKKIIKQRNLLLNQYGQGLITDYKIIEPWTDLLINISSEILYTRLKFIKEFNPIFINNYNTISGESETVTLDYLPNSINKKDIESLLNKEELKIMYLNAFNKVRKEELRRSTTLFGTQKDDVKFTINSGIAREYASQGQHKTLLISLKLAEFEYLKTMTGETPIVLFDDIFSELDLKRSGKVLDIILSSAAQSFITITDSKQLQSFLDNHSYCSIFEIRNGKVNNIY